jgi:hypothetical protein
VRGGKGIGPTVLVSTYNRNELYTNMINETYFTPPDVHIMGETYDGKTGKKKVRPSVT